MITNSPEISRRFKEIHTKMLHKEFVSAGTLLRFRDCCIMTGYDKAREEELEFLEKLDYKKCLDCNWCAEAKKFFDNRIKELKK